MEVYTSLLIASMAILLFLSECRHVKSAEVHRQRSLLSILFADTVGSGDYEEANVDTMEMIIPRRRTTRTRPVYALYSRTKWYLMIKPDGTVSATQDRNNRYAWISFSATGVGLAYIQGVETGLFLAMNEEGELYTTILLENNSSFETMIEDSYQAYSPVTQPHNRNSNNKWYLGIDKQGRVKKSENRCSRSAQFLAIGVF